MLSTREVNEGLVELPIAEAVRRDPDAFSRLYEAYRPSLERYIRARVSQQVDVEDIAGRVFLKAWQAIDRYEDRGRPFSAWLYRLAHNEVIDHYRAGANSGVQWSEDQPDAEDEIHDIIDRQSDAQRLTEALKTLTPEQRAVIIGRFFQGVGNPELARQLGKREGAVRALQMRALQALRRELETREAVA